MKIPTVHNSLTLCCGLLLFASVLEAQPIRIRIGTVAPQDSPWHQTLKQLRQDWQTDRRWSDRCVPGGSRR